MKTVVSLLPPALHAVSAEAGQLSVHPQTKVVSGPLDLQLYYYLYLDKLISDEPADSHSKVFIKDTICTRVKSKDT